LGAGLHSHLSFLFAKEFDLILARQSFQFDLNFFLIYSFRQDPMGYFILNMLIVLEHKLKQILAIITDYLVGKTTRGSRPVKIAD